MLTQTEVHELFDYHEDGYLIWKSDSPNLHDTHRKTGGVAGVSMNRYLKVSIKSAKYSVHRLIWIWHYGYWPLNIDHIDGNADNNRIENLRECTQSQNMGNIYRGKMRGIEKHGRKYRVRISADQGKVELGSYTTLEEAISARDAGYREYFGEFTRV